MSAKETGTQAIYGKSLTEGKLLTSISLFLLQMKYCPLPNFSISDSSSLFAHVPFQ
jgi:hypothetical protein